MVDVVETRLPGVGVRHEFATGRGERVCVLSHRDGRREISIFDRRDPDASATVLHLTRDDTRTLADLLGGSQVSESLGHAQQRVEGLAIEWLPVAAESNAAGSTIGEGAYRARTGASIVAVIREDTTTAAPEPGFRLEPGDTVVAVGTPEGVEQLRDLISR